MRAAAKDELVKVVARRVDEILHYLWDPIGVAGVPQARDEYDSYVLPLVGMLMKEASEGAIANHLREIEVNRMGLNPGSNADERRNEAAVLLIEHYKWLKSVSQHTEPCH